MNSALLSKVAENLQNIKTEKRKAVIGLDGFVDEVVHVVDKRISADEFSRIQTIREYGERIIEGSGLSSNIEIVTINKKIGGNGPIYANGLKRLGVNITYIGSVGEKEIHPVFEELAEGSEMIGVAEPCITEAMEFMDGKIIRSKLNSLNRLTWEDIVRKVEIKRWVELLEESDLISFNNWTMIPCMTDVWEHILKEVVPHVTGDRSKTLMFFDLADPRKRMKQDILKALDLIREFQKSGFRVQLGLNMKEACLIGNVIGSVKKEEMQKIALSEITKLLAEYLNIDAVVVHPVEKAACFRQGNYYEVEGPYCKEPKLTTGAGDIFNSGFVFGQLQQFTPEESLVLGVSASGYYVRNCRNASMEELIGFIQDWKQGKV